MKTITGRTILYHLLTLSIFISYEWYFLLNGKTGASLPVLVTYYAFDIMLFYTLVYFILPTITRKIHLKLFRILLVLLAIPCIALIHTKLSHLLFWLHDITFDRQLFTTYYKTAIGRVIYIFILSASYYLIRSHYHKQIKLLNVLQDNDRLEIALLRSQLSPHLILNALDGVQDVLSQKYPETTYLLDTLSDIVKISVKGSDPNRPPTLGDELELVTKLVDLNEEIGKPCTMDIHVSQTLFKQLFPPKLMANLVENVFRHGNFQNDDTLAAINIKTEDNLLYLHTTNRCFTAANTSGHHIGLNNTIKRLNRYFPENYYLKIEHQNDTYLVSLSINLTNYEMLPY
ncbi:histidine kinase [Sphingobacterium multivorum]|uniref:histidine kinase n=1 Tax=Sphingobacterium multivorum TaxID=28454 RepID=UPI0028A71ACC|nr:histidine kinase [Sphingobacterium multivorum]